MSLDAVIKTMLLLTGVAAIVALVLLQRDFGGSFRLGFLTITVNDFVKPLLLGVAAAAGLTVWAWASGWRGLAIAMLACLVGLGILNFARVTPPIITDADLAVTELYTQLATQGRLLLGPYSRFGWNHPGPTYFYLQAPFYALAGQKAASLYAASVAINLLAVVTLVWVAARLEHGPLAGALAAGCLMLAWRLPRFLASPWTAHVPILAILTFAVLCAAVASGRWRLLPLAVMFGTFGAQTHLALVPAVGVLSIALGAHLAYRRWKGEPAIGRVVHASAWLAVVLWALPISEALSDAGGNVFKLWHFFVAEPGAGQPFQRAFAHWAYGLTGLLRPDFELPWGGHIELRYATLAIPIAVVELLIVSLIARNNFRAGRTFAGYAGLASLLASVVGLWAVTRIHGDVLNHETLWLSAFGMMNLAVIVAACGSAIIPPVRLPAITLRVSLVVLLGLTVLLSVRHLEDLTSFELRRTHRAAIPDAQEAVSTYLRQNGVERPLLVVRGGIWGEAAGVMLRLTQRDTSFSVGEPSSGMFQEPSR